MPDFALVIAALFLPLFPFSMLVVRLFSMLPNALSRVLFLFIWPQIGGFLLHDVGALPDYVLIWALLSSMLYAFRALVLRELDVWTAFMAVSSWSLLWLLAPYNEVPMFLFALGLSAPLMALTLLSELLSRRFGAAYTGIINGLAMSAPRLTGVLAVVLLAVVATPPFPSFSVMLNVFSILVDVAPMFILVAGAIWLLWSWSAARLMQDLFVGEVDNPGRLDIGLMSAGLFAVLLISLAVAGIDLIGGLV